MSTEDKNVVQKGERGRNMLNKFYLWNKKTGKSRRSIFFTAIIGELIILILCLSLGLSRSFILFPAFYLIYIKWINAIFIGIILFIFIFSDISYFKFFVALIIILLLIGLQYLIIFPKDSNKYYAYSWKLVHRHNYVKAMPYLDMAIIFNPKNANAYYERGYANNHMDNYQMAIDDFNKVIQLDPRSFGSFIGIGMANYYLGKYLIAIFNYDRAIQLNPQYSNSYGLRGRAFNRLGSYSSAINDYNKAIQINPRDPISYLDRGNTYYDMHNFGNAILDWEKAISIDPTWEKDLRKWINIAEKQNKRKSD